MATQKNYGVMELSMTIKDFIGPEEIPSPL